MPRVYVFVSLVLLCACDQLPTKTLVLPGGTNYDLRRDDKDQAGRGSNETGQTKSATAASANPSPSKKPAARTGASSSEPAQVMVPPRYDLLEDVDGRIVRLDIDTGEVAIIADGQA